MDNVNFSVLAHFEISCPIFPVKTHSESSGQLEGHFYKGN